MRLYTVQLFFGGVVGTRTFVVDLYASGSTEAIEKRLQELRRKKAIHGFRIELYDGFYSLERFLESIRDLDAPKKDK